MALYFILWAEMGGGLEMMSKPTHKRESESLAIVPPPSIGKIMVILSITKMTRYMIDDESGRK